MASRNDFKLLNRYCEKYYQYLMTSLGKDSSLVKDEVLRRRFGFYAYILENITGIEEVDKLVSLITDTDFNKRIFGVNHDDYGVDSVFIDNDKNIISLFNFKFRDKYKEDARQSLNDNFISSKYLNVLKNEDYSGMHGKPKEFAKEIVEKLQSNEEWEVLLYQVSNEARETPVDDPHVKNLMSSYDISIKVIGLPTISTMMSIRPSAISAEIVLDKDAIMSFSENSISSAKSYICRVQCSDIVRITADDPDLRRKHNLEDVSVLSEVELDFGVLFDNVRGFVSRSKFNPNIIKTLKEYPQKFFMYNNGITMVAKDLKGKPINGDKKVKMSINDFQILNGGQTLRSIHKCNRENNENISKYLCNSEVLVRIFNADSEDDEINKIAEYTNSQNSIKSSDLKALTSEQIDIERYLEVEGILYSRKSGDLGTIDKEYSCKISMVDFGKILMAVNGHPERSTNSVEKIFENHYKELFVEDFDLDKAPKLIRKYFDIKKTYNRSVYKSVQIKYMYVMYLSENYGTSYISSLIELLEKFLKSYKVEDETSDVRKMGQARFKKELDEMMKS